MQTPGFYRSRASRGARQAKAPSTGAKLWQVLLAGFGLLTTLLFLLGAGVTQFLFWLWGLDFLLIASRDDVARAGLSLMLRTSPLIAVGMAAALSAWGHKGPGWRKYLAGCVVAFAAMAFSIPFGKSVPWLAISPFVAAIGAMMVGILVLRREPGQRLDGADWTGFFALFLLAIVLASITPAAEIAAGGYFDHRVRLSRKLTASTEAPVVTNRVHDKNQKKDASPSEAPATCDNYALWIGDKAMVLDCNGADPMSRLKLVYGAHDFEAPLDRRLRPRTLWTPPKARR